MADFKGYYQRSSYTIANLTEIGIVKLEDMGSLPFFSVHYEGKQLPVKSKELCSDADSDADAGIPPELPGDSDDDVGEGILPVPQ